MCKIYVHRLERGKYRDPGVLSHIKMHLRIDLFICCRHLRQKGQHSESKHAKNYGASGLLLLLSGSELGQTAGLCIVFLHLLHMRKYGFALFGEPRIALIPYKQRAAELRLERGDDSAEGRLRKIHALRCLCEIVMFCQSAEALDLMCSHGFLCL